MFINIAAASNTMSWMISWKLAQGIKNYLIYWTLFIFERIYSCSFAIFSWKWLYKTLQSSSIKSQCIFKAITWYYTPCASVHSGNFFRFSEDECTFKLFHDLSDRKIMYIHVFNAVKICYSVIWGIRYNRF